MIMADLSGTPRLIDMSHVVERMGEIASKYITEETDEDGDPICLPRARWSSADAEEYEELATLATEVDENVEEDLSRDTVYLVHEDEWKAYVRQDREDTYGGHLATLNGRTGKWEAMTWSDLMADDLIQHIDWDSVAEADRRYAPEFEFRGATYIRG